MARIRRTNTNKGRGRPLEHCPQCSKKGLGPIKTIATKFRGVSTLIQACRYCGHWKMVETVT